MIPPPRASTHDGSVAVMSDRSETVALRTWPSWALPGALAVAVVSLIGVDGTPDWLERVAFTAVPFALLAAALSVAVIARHWVAVGALVLAASASVVTAMAAGEPAALLAVVAIAAVMTHASPTAAPLDPGLRSLVAAAGSVALVAAWVAATPSRVEPAPSWQQIVAQTGATLRRTIVGVGTDGSSVALMGLLAWLVAAGVLVGLALRTGSERMAGVLPASMAIAVVGSWAIERWRGEVEPGSAMWIMAGATVLTALALPSGATAEHGVGRSLVLLAAISMSLGVVHQVRRAAGSDLRLTGGVLAGAAVVVSMWWASRSRRPRGINVVAARPGAVAAARTLVAALEAAGCAVGDWTLDSAPTTVYGATVVVGAQAEIVAAGSRHPELVDADVRVIGLLTDAGAVASSTLLPDEVWVGTVEQHDALVAAGARRVCMVALPAAPAGGWDPQADAVLADVGRQIRRVIGGWSAVADSPFDADGRDYPENDATRG